MSNDGSEHVPGNFGTSEYINPTGGLPEISSKKVLAVAAVVVGVGTLQYAGLVSAEHVVGVTAFSAGIASMAIDWMSLETRYAGDELGHIIKSTGRGIAWGVTAGLAAAVINEPHINKALVYIWEKGLPDAGKSLDNYAASPTGKAIGEWLRNKTDWLGEGAVNNTKSTFKFLYDTANNLLKNIKNGVDKNESIDRLKMIVEVVGIAALGIGGMYGFFWILGGGSEDSTTSE